MHWAAWKGHTEIAFALVKAGANWYIRDNEGETALQVAIDKHGKDSVIALSLQDAMEKANLTIWQKAKALWRSLE